MRDLLNNMAGNTRDYQPIPFWSWNDKLEPEELRRQIRWMNEHGIGGFFMHARGGLKTKYLSDEWMQCIKACSEEAKKLGMHAWIYDENGWPSGFCGGKLLENPEYRDRYIFYNFGPADEQADVTYLLEGQQLRRVTAKKAIGECLNLYIKSSASTVDILNPEVVDQFLANTHYKYKEQFVESFAQNIRGFFTDEPQYYRWGTPYTPMLETYFQEEYQEDIFDKLGLLFTEKEGYRTFRYRYWCAMQKLMLNNFAKRIYDWCEQEGLQLTGHFIEETTMGYQLMCCGGVMPFYEYEHIPGIDWLYSITDNELPPRQVGSVARQLGKEHVLTESFAACGWNVTPAVLRRVAGFQYANGVNMICHHLMPYSERGQRKRDYPAHFTELNPWIKEHFKEFNDYFTNLGYLLSKGEEPVNVAMLHPMRSIYFDYRRDADGFDVQHLEQQLQKACRMFSCRGIAYHFLDETLMERHGFVEDNRIGCGKCSYDYLVIPEILTMSENTERLVHQFVKNGGKILLLEDAPMYLEGEPYEYSYLQSNCTLEDIVSTQPFKVNNLETELYCTYRTMDTKPFLFIQNASHNVSYTQTFKFVDKHSFVALDPVSMETKKMPLTVTLHEDEALLLFPVEEKMTEAEERKEIELRFSGAEVTFQENYMTVDMVSYSKDGIHYSDFVLTYELFQKLLQERYEGKIWLRYPFDIQTLPEQLSIIIERSEARAYSINGHEFSFTKSWEDEKSFRIADITSFVQQGRNYYEVELEWKQSEATYYALFGENVTESLKNCIAYDSEIEAIYLCGKFGVYSDAKFESHDAETVCSHGFYIGEVPNSISEPVMDGFPFFRGALTMRQNFLLDTSKVVLNIPGDYLTARVTVNGQIVGELLYDRRIDISQYAVEGSNQIEVEFTIGNRNFLGPFHWQQAEGFVGPWDFEDCSLKKSEDGQYRYRFCRFHREK